MVQHGILLKKMLDGYVRYRPWMLVPFSTWATHGQRAISERLKKDYALEPR